MQTLIYKTRIVTLRVILLPRLKKKIGGIGNRTEVTLYIHLFIYLYRYINMKKLKFKNLFRAN